MLIVPKLASGVSPCPEVARPAVAVAGGFVLDVLIRSQELPTWGRDVLATGMMTAPGGKALNQAVVLARHGASTAVCGVVGDDPAGAAVQAALVAEGVALHSMVADHAASTPICLVFTDDTGHGSVVWEGSGAFRSDGERLGAALVGSNVLLVTCELPAEQVRDAVRAGRRHGVRVVVNPAPPPSPAHAGVIPWELVDVLVPNEVEARSLLGERCPVDAAELAEELGRQFGIPLVCVTLAERGCVVWDGQAAIAYPAAPVDVRDVTGASDAFIGSFVYQLVAGAPVPVAVAHALRMAAIAVGRLGSYASLPTRAAIQASRAPHE